MGEVRALYLDSSTAIIISKLRGRIWVRICTETGAGSASNCGSLYTLSLSSLPTRRSAARLWTTDNPNRSNISYTRPLTNSITNYSPNSTSMASSSTNNPTPAPQPAQGCENTHRNRDLMECKLVNRPYSSLLNKVQISYQEWSRMRPMGGSLLSPQLVSSYVSL